MAGPIRGPISLLNKGKKSATSGGAKFRIKNRRQLDSSQRSTSTASTSSLSSNDSEEFKNKNPNKDIDKTASILTAKIPSKSELSGTPLCDCNDYSDILVTISDPKIRLGKNSVPDETKKFITEQSKSLKALGENKTDQEKTVMINDMLGQIEKNKDLTEEQIPNVKANLKKILGIKNKTIITQSSFDNPLKQ